MPSQSDYTGLPQSFVADTLTVYRHFALHGDDLTAPEGIKPMGQSSYSPDSVIYPLDNDFTAVCAQGGGRSDHESPDQHCTCGFYASYDPETDFYSYTTDARAFAAIEVYGKVIMGTKGVRAQKMKLKGIFVQPKVLQITPEEMTSLRDVRQKEAWFHGDAWIVYDALTSSMRMRAAKHGDRIAVIADGVPDEILKVAVDAGFEDYDTITKDRVAVPPNSQKLEAYKVPIFETKEELVKAFPPVSVEELLKKDG